MGPTVWFQVLCFTSTLEQALGYKLGIVQDGCMILSACPNKLMSKKYQKGSSCMGAVLKRKTRFNRGSSSALFDIHTSLDEDSGIGYGTLVHFVVALVGVGFKSDLRSLDSASH